MTFENIDSDGDGNVDSPIDTSGDVRGNRLFMNFSTTTQEARDDRPIATTEAVTLYCDPVNGSDGVATENVTADNPLQTFNEALSRIPYFVLHDFVIDLAGANTISLPATYDSVTAHSSGATHINTWNTSGVIPALRIHGDTSNEQNVVIDSQFVNLGIRTPEVDDLGTDGSGNPEATLSYVTLTGNINNKDGLFRVDNCRFTGAQSGSAILGKAGGTTVLSNNVFESGLEHAANLSSADAKVVFDGNNGNTVNVSGTTVDMETGATARFIGDPPKGQLGAWELSASGQIILDKGRPAAVRKIFVDDFGDGRFGPDAGSERATVDHYTYRPEWEQQNGSPTAEQTHMTLPVGNTTTQLARCRNVFNYFSEWQADVQFVSTPSSGDLRIAANAFGTTGREGVEYVLASDGTISGEYYQDTGTDNTSFITGGSWTPDTNRHTLKMTRGGSSPYTYELFFDGGSEGSNSDSYLADSIYSNFLIQNTTDAEAHIHLVQVR